jgi:hypothetical protein
MFDDINRAFMDLNDLEFQRKIPEQMVRTFLTRFDAIFTLNPDVLLEHFYLCDNVARATVRPNVPGMTPGNDFAVETGSPGRGSTPRATAIRNGSVAGPVFDALTHEPIRFN